MQSQITPQSALLHKGERELFSYDFEPSGSVRLLVSGDVDTQEALDVIRSLVDMKHRELERKARRGDGDGSGED